MYNNKKILGVITARGGSKGIPRKNIKILNGKPLIWHTINAASKSAFLTRFIISTEDHEIANIAKKYHADVPFMRPDELSRDDSKSIDVIKHALSYLEKYEDDYYDYVMILQPTSPLRTSIDIDNCIKIVVDSDADSVISLFELADFSIEKLKKIDNDLILPLLKEEDNMPIRRQDQEKVFRRNSAIFLTKKELIMKGDLFGKISKPYIMPEERSIDINTLVDFELNEFYINKLQRKFHENQNSKHN